MTSVFIADDHKLIRNGIISTLNASGDVDILGEASNGKDALAGIKKLKPDIVLLDISMPDMNGIEVMQELSSEFSSAKVLFLTMYDDYNYINKCLEVGASGYLVKSDVGEEIVEAIKTVAKGGTYFSNSVQKAVMSNYTDTLNKKKKTEEVEIIVLTKREKEVVKLVSDGFTSGQIAEKLFVSPRTIDTHRANLMKKLKVKNSVELVNKVREFSLLDT